METKLTELQQLYAHHPTVKALASQLDNQSVKRLFVSGLQASSAPVVFGSLGGRRVVLYILNDREEAGYFYHDMVQLVGEEQVLFFPSSYSRAIKYGRRDAANEILRTEVLARLQQFDGQAADGFHVVTHPEALAELVVSPKELSDQTLQLSVGQKIQSTHVEGVLVDLGFEHVDYVYEPGQFAMRGSILDVFSFSSEYPFRIDFFGDEIDSIRTFEVENQLSRERMKEVTIVPELGKDQGDDGVCFLDFLPDQSLLAVKDFRWVCERLDALRQEAVSTQAAIAMESEEHTFIHLPSLVAMDDFVSKASGFRRVEFGNRPSDTPEATIGFEITPQPIFHKNFDLVTPVLGDYLNKGYTLYILADSQKQIDRLRAIFDERSEEPDTSPIVFTPMGRTLHEGYADDTLRACFFTDHQFFDRFHKYNLRSDKARSGKVALTLKELQQFEPGDFIVHIDHGVGRFAGLVRIPSGNSTQEVIKLLYQNDDVVFVSIHALHKVSKYKGKEGEPPRLNKLGTGAWERIKEKTKKKIKDIARDLIKLYARRREEPGYAYTPDTFLQHELEASFLYEDTPDQLKATQEVKADMEKARPMDRLVCGDVGFGKTEVAVRAAFKAVCDNKQVAVLVPTTVLAYQHYRTFSERLKEFPCKIDYISRSRKPSAVKRILKELKEGEINIIVGTHRLVGKDISFKDLGLLIIDEEQKFGVSVKEKLRQLKANVDTLTLTATPIPRTLQFSLMGARDLSIIQTPPPNRHPIQTEVHTFDEEIFIDAVNFEMSRGGQVFIVNNRIRNLVELADMIQKRIPDARICIGHGQMEPDKLEQVILDFVNFDYDVLIATTIIESGIDIPNVNTIIVNQAHNFGLSDLHQLRGRVGRGNRKAFCYLIAPPLSTLTPEARRRLQAIENFSGLGSGIHIAMQDLDIRGAGNMLGAEQSGFIADLGYETYQKILTEAVCELKTDEFAELYADEVKANGEEVGAEEFVAECQIESDLELLFPDSYIPSSSERMLLYRELDSLQTTAEVDAYRQRLEDRFGKVPPEGEELMRVVSLRRLGKRLGAEKITLKAGRLILYFVGNPDSLFYQSASFGKSINFMARYPRRCNLREQNGKRSMVVLQVPDVQTAVAVLQEVTTF
ncbi:MAG: transcription-repair coupling factor [Bacteroidaceae bacterium]|nr:transcription-repair coupling factor [Bacteroidaceae bacterium]